MKPSFQLKFNLQFNFKLQLSFCAICGHISAHESPHHPFYRDVMTNQLDSKLLISQSEHLQSFKLRPFISSPFIQLLNIKYKCHIFDKSIASLSLNLVSGSKLYTPSTLNIDLILWHTQLIVCAEKC